MTPLERGGLFRERDAFDAAVARTPGVDVFCSQSAWALSADAAMMPERDLWAYRGREGWIALARRWHEGWSSLEALEASWCFASPFAYDDDGHALAHAFADTLARDAPRDILLLSGLAPGAPFVASLLAALAPRYMMDTRRLPPTLRYRARLEGGVDGFLSRRSSTFRARLRQAERKARAAGVSVEKVSLAPGDDGLGLYARLLDVETRSWKGREGDGLLLPTMQAFYRLMIPMLAARGAVRAHALRLHDRDVAVIVGAVTDTPEGAVYRGLQFSFDDDHRALSLGNLAQLAQVRALSEEGVAVYDLGSDVEYKRRWGEEVHETVCVLAVPEELRRRR